MITYANVFSIFSLLLFVAAVALLISSFTAYPARPSNETDTSVLTQKNVSGTNIRSNPQSEQSLHERLLAGGVACACLWLLFAFLAFVCFCFRPDSGDQSTDENPSCQPQVDIDALVLGTAERLSAINRNDQEGIANEPPDDVSSSDETAVLFREMLKLDSISNAEAGGLRLRERRESEKAMTGEDGPSATMCAASPLISSQGQPSSGADHQEDIAKEPPRVSSSKTAPLSREMVEGDSNAEAGGSRLPEKRESGKAMTGEDDPSSVTICPECHLIRSQGQPCNELDSIKRCMCSKPQ